MLLKIENISGITLTTSFNVTRPFNGGLSLVFDHARGTGSAWFDLSMEQFERAYEDAVQDNKVFFDLTSKGVAAIKAKYTPA